MAGKTGRRRDLKDLAGKYPIIYRPGK